MISYLHLDKDNYTGLQFPKLISNIKFVFLFFISLLTKK